MRIMLVTGMLADDQNQPMLASCAMVESLIGWSVRCLGVSGVSAHPFTMYR